MSTFVQETMTSTKSQRNLPSLPGKHVHIIVVKMLIVFGLVFKTRIKSYVTTPSKDQRERMGKKRSRCRGAEKGRGQRNREKKNIFLLLRYKYVPCTSQV